MTAPIGATRSRGPSWLFPTLHGYRRTWLGRDLVAGVATGAVIIPQAMAYATIAGMPVEVGLYTCMVPLVLYAALGGSRVTSSTTTSTIATLTASTLIAAGVAVSSLDAADSVPGNLATLVVLSGAFLLLARLLRLGSLVENISEATLTGVKIGVGLTVAVGQLPDLLGVQADTEGKGFLHALDAVIHQIGHANPATIALSAGSVAVLFLLPKVLPKVPTTLVVVIAGILLVAFTGIADHGVAKIAPVPSGLPPFSLPDLTHLSDLVPGALAIAFMAFLETVSVARNLRKTDDPPVDSNQELLAAGVCCVGGGFTGTLPSAGGFSQSAVNDQSGARSQLAGLVTALLAVLIALFLAPVLDDLPRATLAAIVFVAVLGLVDVPGLIGLWRINRTEFWTAAATAVLGLTVGLLAAVGFGVVATLVLVLRAVNRPALEPLTEVEPGLWVSERVAGQYGTPPPDGILVVTAEHGLYAANTRANCEAVVDLAQRTAAARPVHTVILDLRRQPALTTSVIKGLQDLDHELAARGLTLYLASIGPDQLHRLDEIGRAGGTRRHDRIFDAVADAVRAAGRHSEPSTQDEPRRPPG